MIFYSAKAVSELFFGIIRFPLWWYSGGLMKLIRRLKIFLNDKEKSLAFFVWVKNVFRPMYGQNDITGFLISFMVRMFQIIFRGIILSFWVIIAISAVLLWLILPFFVVYQIILQS
ncbi:MAG: hypothetical protein AAB906_02115 [Patescibacteria group bacterium]